MNAQNNFFYIATTPFGVESKSYNLTETKNRIVYVNFRLLSGSKSPEFDQPSHNSLVPITGSYIIVIIKTDCDIVFALILVNFQGHWQNM